MEKNVSIDSSTIILSPEKLTVGNNSRIDAFCLLIGDIKIGENVHVAPYVQISANNGFVAEDYVGVGSHSIIHTADADYSKGTGMTNPTIPKELRGMNTRKGPVIMKKHSLIGDQCVILPDVTIGEGATFGAFSLLREKQYKPWMVHVGIPAREMKVRPKEIILENEKKLREG